MEAGQPSTVRFGNFEVDLEAGELKRNGLGVRIQDQPFQILATLLARPGQVITREELRQKIWPDHTFVDFQRGINKAINRLRDALGDCPEAPLYIQTLARRGYRFIASVERQIRSMAVLPLENLSGDAGQDYWADGVTDQLISQCAKISGLRTISRTSVMRFKNTRAPLPEITQQLKVDAVLEGSVYVYAQRIRVSVRLIDCGVDRPLWTETYDRALEDASDISEQIAQGVAHHIQARLAMHEQTAAQGRRTIIPEAYEAYLKGRYFWNKRTESDLEKSLEYFNRALEYDPSYSAAFVGLADLYILLGILGLRRPHDVYPQARSAATRALELDPAVAEAHKSLAAVRNHYDWDWRGAEQQFQRALELDCNSSVAHQWYGAVLLLLKRHDEAIAEVRRARDLDPLSPSLTAFMGLIYMKTRAYDQALEACRAAKELDPNHPFGYWVLARTLDARGDLRQALEISRTAAKLSGDDLLYTAHLGYALARAGENDGARVVANKLQQYAQTRYVCSYDIAMIYVGLREKDTAFKWFERALEERTVRLCEINDPAFDEIRSDRRFQALVQKVGIPS
jgi:TolB-like protein/Tfp pilus assembly protein PilF